MKCPFRNSESGPTRRGLLAGAGGLIAGLSAGGVARAAAPDNASAAPSREAFYGAHQAGIATPQQAHTYFVSFDLVAKTRDEVVAMLKAWTEAAARMTSGETARALGQDLSAEAGDGGSVIGLAPARLTLTFGFGPGLFVKDGVDRYGLAAKRPAALADLPKFNGDQLMPARTGGDLSVQACADDPFVAFHAIRELDRLAYGTAEIRWMQTGFQANTPAGETGRNLMGFVDGTNNPRQPGTKATVESPRDFDDVVWVGDEGPDWMRGGSYVVARRIRISLEHWDRTEVDFQEQVIGRHKYSGAPLGKNEERAPLELDRADADGNPVVPETSHVRLGAAASNDGAQMFRRGYSYNDGVAFTAERWPPWRQGMLYDAGLLFVAYQRDPRTAFVKVFEPMAKLDALNQFTTHTGSGLFACPAGVREGEFIGQRLFA
ncbi:iron uptake transporter deferrochelatase/peroxidase subunit [Methylovirgula sp. 4M-Z18]|uniref:iron uptake transporter deferrochelatase/peroxidase subunit n=1 Tax=Methylovirgula sp. 4M-Z18 TaxID=2293567 RepID=UPI000E2F02E7|nr:iron uptake transporter deferrochelatase/peroxidase subunit [Methylovirgula sp. 4M-Z18]RFB78458.1 deferrochelatase/peroxidase EfeB [Methylovirgula sp. 4M-Z18]